MKEDLIYIEQKLEEIERNKREYGDFYRGIIEDYDELIYFTESTGYIEKVLDFNLQLLQIMNEKNNNEFNMDNYKYYLKILDLYIQLKRYKEAYEFANEVYNKEYMLSDGDVLAELIEVYIYIPCLCYKLNDLENYTTSSKNLYDLTKNLIDEELGGDNMYFGEIYFSMGKIFILLNEYDKAIEYYEKSHYYYDNISMEIGGEGISKILYEMLKKQREKTILESETKFYGAMIEAYTLKGDKDKAMEFIEKINHL